MIVEYHPAVEAELKDIESYYENRSPSLGRHEMRRAASEENWDALGGRIVSVFISQKNDGLRNKNDSCRGDSDRRDPKPSAGERLSKFVPAACGEVWSFIRSAVTDWSARP